MVAFLSQLLLAIRSRFTRGARLEAENLILRQQLVVLRRKSPTRVRLWNIDRLLLVWLYRLYLCGRIADLCRKSVIHHTQVLTKECLAYVERILNAHDLAVLKAIARALHSLSSLPAAESLSRRALPAGRGR
jgi:hypothetical protein